MTNFKVGNTVKITGNTSASVNKVGDIGVITKGEDEDGMFKVEVEGRNSMGNWTRTCDMELVTTPDVPIGYVGSAKDMNLKDGDVIKGTSSGSLYTIANGMRGEHLVGKLMGYYQLISRAREWVFTDNPDYTTHDVATYNGMPVAARKKAPVVKTIGVRMYADTGFLNKATVNSTNGVPDWSTLTVD
jgi:hypothetical protein